MGSPQDQLEPPALRDTQKKMRRLPSGQRVLVVDDSASTRRAIKSHLAVMGHDVTLAASGEEAFALCMEHPFDLLVSDVTMGAVSGVHLCRMLRAEPCTANLPIVLLTADDGPRSRFWGTHAGCDAYVSKREPDALPGAVARALAARPGSKPVRGVRRTVDPLERLARVLDDHLLQAVIDREARSLMSHVEDRAALMDGALRLFDDVLACPYAILRIDGKGGSSTSSAGLLCRGTWPDEPARRDLLSLGLAPAAPPSHVRRSVLSTLGSPVPGEFATEPILAGRELIGQLRLYGGRRGIGRDDKDTASWLAAALGPVIKSMLLVEETRHLATTDGLTGLRNRRTITNRMQEETARGARYGTPVSIILCDIDHFKAVNDTYGHATGDVVIKELGEILRSVKRDTDIVARFGGEEFCVLCEETEVEGARLLAERLREELKTTVFQTEIGRLTVTASLGVATFYGDDPNDPKDGGALFEASDKALYAAKHGGRDQVAISAH